MFMLYYLLVVRGTDGCYEGWSISERVNVTRGASNGSGFDDEEYVYMLCCVCVWLYVGVGVYMCVWGCVWIYVCVCVCMYIC